MSVNLHLVSLIILLVIFVCGLCLLKEKNHTRLLLALVLLVTLLVVNHQLNKRENFATMIDENVLLSGGNRLEKEQEQTSRELDVLQGQINLMKRLYINNINKVSLENTPSIELKCSPPINYFSEGDGDLDSENVEIDGLSMENLGITQEQLQNVLNNTNNIVN